MTLQDELDALREKIERGGPPYNVPGSALVAMARATRELIASGQADRAMIAGEVAPSFELLTSEGRAVRSAALLTEGPLVLAFYRGGWCPYCNIELLALERARAGIEERGATLVALSMQNALHIRRVLRRTKVGFPLLIDAHGRIAEAFGIRFQLPDYLIDVYKRTFKNDLAVVNDDDSWTLPMPARYVIGQDGIIAYADVNADYTRRPDPSDVYPTLDRLLRTRAA